MSIEVLIRCSCGHSVNEHEAGGCAVYARGATGARRCECSLSRADALDSIVATERTAIHDRWRAYQERPNA